MSLVNEALKKARLEAARQEAARRGLPPPPDLYSARPRRRWPLVAAALVLAVAAALLFWAGRRSADLSRAGAPTSAADSHSPGEIEGPGTDPPAAAAPAASPAVPAPASTGAAADEETPVPSPAPSPAPRADPQPQPQPQPEPPVRIALEDRSLPDSTARRVVEPAPDAPSQTPSYASPVELPGGRLDLGGIAWSERRPFALINGSVVGPGDRIEQYTVVRIDPQQVELNGDQGSFILRLK